MFAFQPLMTSVGIPENFPQACPIHTACPWLTCVQTPCHAITHPCRFPTRIDCFANTLCPGRTILCDPCSAQRSLQCPGISVPDFTTTYRFDTTIYQVDPGQLVKFRAEELAQAKTLLTARLKEIELEEAALSQAAKPRSVEEVDAQLEELRKRSQELTAFKATLKSDPAKK